MPYRSVLCLLHLLFCRPCHNNECAVSSCLVLLQWAVGGKVAVDFGGEFALIYCMPLLWSLSLSSSTKLSRAINAGFARLFGRGKFSWRVSKLWKQDETCRNEIGGPPSPWKTADRKSEGKDLSQ